MTKRQALKLHDEDEIMHKISREILTIIGDPIIDKETLKKEMVIFNVVNENNQCFQVNHWEIK